MFSAAAQGFNVAKVALWYMKGRCPGAMWQKLLFPSFQRMWLRRSGEGRPRGLPSLAPFCP